LLRCSAELALGIACYLLFAVTIAAYGNPFERVDTSALTLHIMAIVALIAGMLWLSIRLRRGLRAGGLSFEANALAGATGAYDPAWGDLARRAGK
jgi:hypothetical protein